MTQPTQAVDQLVDEPIRRINVAIDLIPVSDDDHGSLREALDDLQWELRDDGHPPDQIIAAVAHALLDPPPGSVTVVAGDESDVRRLAVAVFGGADPIPAQLAKARRWLATLAENGAHHA